jgi:hypothetical protein
MSPFNDREDRDAEEREEGPEERYYDPPSEEFSGKHVRCSVKTEVSLVQFQKSTVQGDRSACL